jgi:hypothetical protein
LKGGEDGIEELTGGTKVRRKRERRNKLETRNKLEGVKKSLEDWRKGSERLEVRKGMV